MAFRQFWKRVQSGSSSWLASKFHLVDSSPVTRTSSWFRICGAAVSSLAVAATVISTTRAFANADSSSHATLPQSATLPPLSSSSSPSSSLNISQTGANSCSPKSPSPSTSALTPASVDSVKSSSPLSELEMPCQSLLIDYANLFGQTRLPNHYPPLPKYSVLVLGTTNAGKSSLLNHLYGLSIKEFGPAQIDTCFTLVEALPDSEFQRFVGGTRNSNIHTTIAASASADDVVKRAPMPGQWASDPRRGVVYIELDEEQTMRRYGDSLSGLPQTASVKTLIVNSKFTKTKPDLKHLTEHAIFIDTPGFDMQQRLPAVERTLRSFARFYSSADIALFLMPADSINTIREEVNILEYLAATAHVSGPHDLVGEYLSHAQSQSRSAASASISDSSGTDSNLRPQVGRASDFLDWLQSSPKALASIHLPFDAWRKMRFVITKTDCVHSGRQSIAPISSSSSFRTDAQSFELGVRLGQQLRALPTPSFSQHVRYISLPGQSAETNPDSRDLGALEGELVAQQSQWSYPVQLARFQLQASTDIIQHINSSWPFQTAYWRLHKLARAKACKAHVASSIKEKQF